MFLAVVFGAFLVRGLLAPSVASGRERDRRIRDRASGRVRERGERDHGRARPRTGRGVGQGAPRVSLGSGGFSTMHEAVRRLHASIVEEESGRVRLSDGRSTVVLCPGMFTVLVNGAPVGSNRFVSADESGLLVPADLLAKIEMLFKTAGISTLRRIVIDPGHGGRDPGAIGRGGLTEKELNLSVCRRLAKILQKRGVEVVLTRNRDVFISLDQRVRICNREKPDLFLSVHANANTRRAVTGIETFVIRESISDLQRARSAIRSGSRKVEGVALKKGDGYLSLALHHTLFDMSRRQSRRLGAKVQKSLVRGVRDGDRGLKSAGFRVLKGARCPAILVEIGFLSNPSTERRFRRSAYLDRIARSIADAL
jgi:N-acetylmuramoyl-L-alanine amidase